MSEARGPVAAPPSRPPGQSYRDWRRKLSDTEWADELTSGLPSKWRRRLLDRFHKRRAQGHDWMAQQASRVAANREIREIVAGLGQVRTGLDASDADLCQAAHDFAKLCMSRAEIFRTVAALHPAMERIARHQGIDPPSGQHISVAGAIARMTDELWWRRQLRKLHAKQVEGAAIHLGYVNRSRECYVSNQSLWRRQAQNQRNAATLEATLAINEHGQQFTLAELAATSTANKSIKRAELMTRIAGFEKLAQDQQHAGLFFTITCPSHMHKWRTGDGGRVHENRRYSGVNPREAQTYLCKVWARIRTALQHAGIRIYGFRIAEPNHDGTPHWHVLIFHAPEHDATLRAIVLKYALKDSPDEAGAAQHRVDFKPIDWKRGSAAGYIAKYVAKNIDGHKLESDRYGNGGTETAQRVEAWAATWGIRQFQQVGGPPVGPWRELRRVKALPQGAPEHLVSAWNAVNKAKNAADGERGAVAWDRYCQAQGGVFCGRQYRIRIATRTMEGQGRYGEQMGERPIGVSTTHRELWTPAHMAHMGGKSERVVHWICESTRYRWEISKQRREASPWTGVNNCTDRHAHSPQSWAVKPDHLPPDITPRRRDARHLAPLGQAPSAPVPESIALSAHGGPAGGPTGGACSASQPLRWACAPESAPPRP